MHYNIIRYIMLRVGKVEKCFDEKKSISQRIPAQNPLILKRFHSLNRLNISF